jgi:hypothetical protein
MSYSEDQSLADEDYATGAAAGEVPKRITADAKKSIKRYFELDRELKEAGKILGGLRSEKRKISKSLMTWMKTNEYLLVRTKYGRLQRIKTRGGKVPLNRQYVFQYAMKVRGMDEAEAEAMCVALYDERPEKDDAEGGGESIRFLKPEKVAVADPSKVLDL